MRRKTGFCTLLLLVLMLALLPQYALAETPLLPEVTAEMCDAAFWAERQEDPDALLADAEQIRALNRSCWETPACMMTDMAGAEASFDQQRFYKNIWRDAFDGAAGWMAAPYYDSQGAELIGPELNRRLANIGGDAAAETAEVGYGICVRRTDVLALPGEQLMTDELGDLDFDYNQISSVRVNEPVLVKAESVDGKYLYCDTDCVSGWVRAEDIALCAGREEWLSAWSFPDEEALVVTAGKLYLENSNVNPAGSELLLTMGTVLQRVAEEEYDAEAVNRAPYHNYAVWLPVREADGSYGRIIGLVPANRGVSEGCVELTTENILKVALSRLGDAYGWGGMLNSVDCSAFVRDVYRCFGLTLPRNTTWQSKMPVEKLDVSQLDEDAKRALLDELPAGAVLYFSGHEMLYLGKADGQYYVLSAVSSMLSPDEETGGRLRVRSIVISSLDTKRMNGRTWLQELNLMLLPYAPQETEAAAAGTEEDAEAAASNEAEEPAETEEPAEPEEDAETAVPNEPEVPAETEEPTEPEVPAKQAEPVKEESAPIRRKLRSVNTRHEDPDEPAGPQELVEEKPQEASAEPQKDAAIPTLPGGPANSAFMQQAIEEALYGVGSRSGGPFGSVIVKDGAVLGKGHDRTQSGGDHAEEQAIAEAKKTIGSEDLSGCILYTTAQPCEECLLACREANIDFVRYGCTAADCTQFGLEIDAGDSGAQSPGAYLVCSDRSACLRLFALYNELEAAG